MIVKGVNVGLILEFRSNAVADRSALDVFKFDGESEARPEVDSHLLRHRLRSFHFESVSNFSIQSSFFIPLVDQRNRC